jgi:hypothetical protein
MHSAYLHCVCISLVWVVDDYLWLPTLRSTSIIATVNKISHSAVASTTCVYVVRPLCVHTYLLWLSPSYGYMVLVCIVGFPMLYVIKIIRAYFWDTVCMEVPTHITATPTVSILKLQLARHFPMLMWCCSWVSCCELCSSRWSSGKR